MNTAVAQVESAKTPVTLREALADANAKVEQLGDQFYAVLPAHIPVERFKRVLMTAIQNNPDLLKCERRSLWNAAMGAAKDGLLPDGREGALVPFNDKARGKIATWIPMIAGLRKKVRNSGEIATWDAQVVHEKDHFDYQLGDDPFIKHTPFMGDRGKIIAAYSVAVLKSGEKSREVMSVTEIERVRSFAPSKNSPAWRDHYGEMCRKTVARRHSKILPMSTDLDDLMRRDDELYNFQGERDAEQAPPRPQLRDFMGGNETLEQIAEPEGQGDAADTEEAPAQPLTAAACTSPADAHAFGRQQRDENFALKAVPGEWRGGTPEHQSLIEAREDGWRQRDEEISEAAKAGKK